MSPIDFSPLYRSAVGFDRLFALLDAAVQGRKAANDDQRRFLHRGLAERNFERRFQLADHVLVKDASLADGLLTISLERELPEQLKPRTIPINTAPNALIEGEKAA